MTTELAMLIWAIVLGLVHAVVTGQLTVAQHGMAYGLSPRDEKKPLTGIPARIERAFANYMQTFPFFAATVLIVQLLNRHNTMTVIGAEMYVWARLAFIPLYAMGVIGVRTLAYVVAMAGIVVMLLGLS